MSLEQKVGQIVQGDIASVTPDDVRRYHLGSVLNGGNSDPGGRYNAPAKDWLALADAFYEASMAPDGKLPRIPIMWGSDAVHGHNNVVGATLFRTTLVLAPRATRIAAQHRGGHGQGNARYRAGLDLCAHAGDRAR
jgi:beta-glucosidase-like glycosyl hydrolase